MKPLRATRRILLAIAALLALAAAVLLTADLGFLREALENRASSALGRTLSLDGGLSIRLGRTSRIEARGLRLADVEGSGRPDLLAIERILLEVDTLSLWGGTVPVIEAIEAQGVRLHWVEDRDGRANWDLGGDEDSGAPGGAPFLLARAQVTDVEFEWRSPRLAEPVLARFDSVQQQIDAHGTARLSVEGRIQDEGVSLAGAVGPWDRLLDGKDVTLQVEGRVGQGRLQFEGQFDRLWSPRRPVARLHAQSPSMRHLAGTLGLGDWGDGELKLDAETRRQGERLGISLRADAGGLRAELSADALSLADLEDLGIQAHAEGPSLGNVLRLFNLPGWPDRPFRLAANLHRSGPRLEIEQLELALDEASLRAQGALPALPSLAGARLDLAVAGPRLQDFSAALGIGELPAGPFRIEGRAGDGADQRTDLDLKFELGPGQGQVKGNVAGPEDFQLEFSLQGNDLASLKRLQGLATLPTGPFRAVGWVRGGTAGTDFELDFAAPPGRGQASGSLSRDARLGLKLDATGSLASRVGLLFGIEGLPPTPWTLQLDLSQPVAQALDITALVFDTAEARLSISGRLGTAAEAAGTNLRVDLAGARLTPFQALAPQGFRLPDEAFSLAGTVASRDQAWQLQPLDLRVGDRRLTLSGRVGSGADLAGTQLRFDLAGRDFRILADLPGPARLPEGALAVNGQVAIGPGEIQLESLHVQAGDLEATLEATAAWPLDLSHGRIRLEAQGGDITQVLPAMAGLDLQQAAFRSRINVAWDGQTIRIEDTVLTVGDARLQASGLVDLPPNTSGTDLALQVHVPDLARLGAIDAARWGGMPFDFETRLTGTPAVFEASALRARLGDSAMHGLVRLNLDGSVPEFDLELSAETLDLRPFLDGATEQPAPKAGKKDRLIPDVPLPIGPLGRANGAFELAVGRLLLQGRTLSNGLVRGRLRNGQLQLDELGVDTSGGRLSGSLDVTPAENQRAEVKLGLHGKGLILNFSDAPPERKREEPALDIDLELAARGSTTRELAASLNGSFVAFSPGGRVRNDRGLRDNTHLLAQVVAAISPQAALADHIEIACFAAAGRAREGVVLLDPGIVLQSSRLITMASGTVNLASEKLDLGFSSRTRHLVDISASDLVSPFLRVGGTLAKPSIQLDKKGTLLSGGAAVLSGGLSILAKKAIDQLDSSPDPCQQLLGKAGKRAPEP